MFSSINLEEKLKIFNMGMFQSWIYAYLLHNEMKETAEAFRNEANPSKLKMEKFWGNVKGKIDKLWHLYIQDDQHELNELKKIYEEWNIKVEASLRQDTAHFGRKSFGKPPYIPHSTCLLDARKAYQMESSSVEGMLPNDIMEVILSKLPYTRFFNAIFRYMRTNSMEESLCLFKKESDIHLINPQAFDAKKDDLFEFWKYYMAKVRYVKPLFKGEEEVTM